jgi:hypothetical protein
VELVEIEEMSMIIGGWDGTQLAIYFKKMGPETLKQQLLPKLLL